MKIYVAGVDSLRQFLRGDLIMRQKTSSILLVLATESCLDCKTVLETPVLGLLDTYKYCPLFLFFMKYVFPLISLGASTADDEAEVLK